MCGLCGIFGSDDHWSAASPTLSASADPVGRRRDRNARISAVNQMLSRQRVQLSDWQGQSYVLRGPTGQQSIVSNVTEVWASLEDDFGKEFDPLDVANFPSEGPST
ncbi:hypothetical protein GP644_07230 [Parasedimentitalea maritima]|uniref:Uncharacterized protein n=1 Tax=Parasedimentitalea maritima TaxID=2578117 RepID=A0A6A4RIC0_9RHOB|nr:hypothetical protein GP644_07230 [Zongyanglinia marina]